MNPSLLDRGISTVIVLFILSMISERLVNWMKLHFGQEGRWLWGFSSKQEDLTRKQRDEKLENLREQKILGLNIIVSIVIAFLSHADLFKIISSNSPNNVLGWTHYNLGAKDFWLKLQHPVQAVAVAIVGCILTGLFISLGSKFWHDLLDMLLEIKNYKRVLADPETYKIDNVKSLEKMLNTYQSDFIKLAYTEASTKYMAMENIKAVSLKQDNDGYYFELTVKQSDPALSSSYQYILSDGTPQNIRVKIRELGNDIIVAHSLNLSDKIFALNTPDNTGTIGCMVKERGSTSSQRYLLTCAHNVVSPITRLPLPNPSQEKVEGQNRQKKNSEIGTIYKAMRDHEVDAALIKLNTNSTILNEVSNMGKPRSARKLLNADKGLQVYMYGAESKKLMDGVVTSLYTSVKIDYGNSGEFQYVNLIAIAKEGSAITTSGDSGSCIMDNQSNVVGLVVGGSTSVTYIIPITTLISKLNVELA